MGFGVPPFNPSRRQLMTDVCPRCGQTIPGIPQEPEARLPPPLEDQVEEEEEEEREEVMEEHEEEPEEAEVEKANDQEVAVGEDWYCFDVGAVRLCRGTVVVYFCHPVV